MRSVDFGRVNNSRLNFFVSGPKFTQFLSNVGGIVVDNAVFRLSMSWSVPEIFVIEVLSCRKSRLILDVYGPIIFWGGPPFMDFIFLLPYISDMLQSFTVISRRSSEISRKKEKKHQQ